MAAMPAATPLVLTSADKEMSAAIVHERSVDLPSLIHEGEISLETPALDLPGRPVFKGDSQHTDGKRTEIFIFARLQIGAAESGGGSPSPFSIHRRGALSRFLDVQCDHSDTEAHLNRDERRLG